MDDVTHDTVARTPEPTGPAHAAEHAEHAEHAEDAVVLLARIAAGDHRALAGFYDRFARRVWALTRRICGSESAAEDVCQEVFLEVWRRAGRYDPARGSPATWLLTLAHHTAVDAVRREATVRRHIRPGTADDHRDLPVGPGADQAAVGAVVAGHVRGALGELPPAQRETLALAYYGGYTQAEVAAILGIPVGTVKSRTFTAMALLRERLAPLAL